jgi:hypothetical protein
MVNSFEVLENKSLSETVIALRGLEGKWGKDSLYEILKYRNSDKDDH